MHVNLMLPFSILTVFVVGQIGRKFLYFPHLKSYVVALLGKNVYSLSDWDTRGPLMQNCLNTLLEKDQKLTG